MTVYLKEKKKLNGYALTADIFMKAKKLLKNVQLVTTLKNTLNYL